MQDLLPLRSSHQQRNPRLNQERGFKFYAIDLDMHFMLWVKVDVVESMKNNNIIIYQQDSRFIVKLFALNRRQARHTKCHSIHHSQDAIDVREQQAAGEREGRHQEVSRCIQSSAMQPGMIWAECQFLGISSTHARGIHGMGVRYPVLQLNEGSDPPQLLCFF